MHDALGLGLDAEITAASAIIAAPAMRLLLSTLGMSVRNHLYVSVRPPPSPVCYF